MTKFCNRWSISHQQTKDLLYHHLVSLKLENIPLNMKRFLLVKNKSSLQRKRNGSLFKNNSARLKMMQAYAGVRGGVGGGTQPGHCLTFQTAVDEMKAGCCFSEGRGQRDLQAPQKRAVFVSFKLLSFYSFHSRFFLKKGIINWKVMKKSLNLQCFSSLYALVLVVLMQSISSVFSVLRVSHLTPVCVPVCLFYFSVSHSLALVDEEVSFLLFRVFIFPGNCAPTITIFFIFLPPFILLFVSLCFTYFCL